MGERVGWGGVVDACSDPRSRNPDVNPSVRQLEQIRRQVRERSSDRMKEGCSYSGTSFFFFSFPPPVPPPQSEM